SRSLTAFRAMRAVTYTVHRTREEKVNKRGEKYIHWDTQPTLTLAPTLYDPQTLASPISPRAKTGSRHGGYREACPHCHAPGEEQEDMRRCRKCGHVYRGVDIPPATDADDPTLHDATTASDIGSALKLQDAKQEQPGCDLDVLSCNLQPPPP